MDFSDNYNALVEKTNDLTQYTDKELQDLLAEAKEIHMQYKNMQLVVKCDANSLYGVSASIYFSLCDFDIAEDITMTGKHFCVLVDHTINNFFVTWADDPKNLKLIQQFYPDVTSLKNFTEYVPDTVNDLCIYGDTDSRYVHVGKIYTFLNTKDSAMVLTEDNKELADFSIFLVKNFIDTLIKVAIDADCDYRNARKGYLKFNHEVTAKKCIFQTKKKYILPIVWEDGKYLEKTKLKFKGVELKKGTSSPRIKMILEKLVKKFLLDGYTVADLRVECLKIIRYIKHVKQKDMLYLISTVSGMGSITKNADGSFISEKNHIQMQIALSWYNFIHDNNLEQEYTLPFEGQKMNYYYCDENSKYKVIGIPDNVNINTVKNLPEPDINKMINKVLIMPLLRYIYEEREIKENDAEHFLLGVKKLKF